MPSPAATAAIGTYLFLMAAGTVLATGFVLKGLRDPIPWSTLARRLVLRPWQWRDAALLAGLVGLLILLTFGLTLLLREPGESTLLVLQTLITDVGGLALLAAYLRFRGLRWASALGLGRPAPRRLVLGGLAYLALIPLVVFSSLVSQGILTVKGYPPNMQEVALLLSADHPLGLRLYLIGLAVLIAPCFEECLFRGVLFPLLARRFGAGAGVVLVSALFSAIHWHLPSALPLFVVACGFSVAYLYTGTLWAPILMHALFNGVNLTLLLTLKP
jgi:membrane protease YdiL (CAAX protease family)